jgi:hypothetical protein
MRRVNASTAYLLPQTQLIARSMKQRTLQDTCLKSLTGSSSIQCWLLYGDLYGILAPGTAMR